MIQGNCREENDYVILTRKCPKCKKLVHIVEVDREEYNNSIEILNKIVELVGKKNDENAT
jgi:phage FluMu protein Com